MFGSRRSKKTSIAYSETSQSDSTTSPSSPNGIMDRGGINFPQSPSGLMTSSQRRLSAGLVTSQRRLSASSSSQYTQSILAGFFSLGSNNDDKGSSYCGSLHFSLRYDFPRQILAITIIEAKDLLAMDRGGTSDPYVKMNLLPDKKKKLETKVVFKKLNPTWNETLFFNGYPHDKLQKRVLHMVVLDYDKFSRDDPIGEINIPLCEVDFAHPLQMWRELNPISKEKYRRGEIMITLTYNPLTGILTVTIVKARDLKPMDISGTSDPYVKVYNMYQTKRLQKVKTTTKYQTLNPVFDENFSFTIPTHKLEDTQIVVTVMDKDLIKWNEKIGARTLT
ncbi:synaptotagmin-7-like isoform X2 [Symsagittifera roscoffensis]|uniref:synaptotagmin-7-like isoform X2 n=1 Tax=Symsagittifera roscoffensis TaxID=84072 RepID=UPI00307BB933